MTVADANREMGMLRGSFGFSNHFDSVQVVATKSVTIPQNFFMSL